MILYAAAIKSIALISYIILAFLTLRSNTETNVRRFFFIYLFGMVFWQFTSLMVTLSRSPDKALLWYNLLTGGFGLISILFFPFTRAFLKIQKQKVLSYLSYAACLFMLVTGITGLLIKDVYFGKAGYYVPNFTKMFYPLSVVIYFFWGFGVYNLTRGLFKKSSPLQKNRIKYPLMGAIIVLAGASTNFTVLQDYPIDILCNLLNALLIGYAVIRYRLLDIRIILKRSLLYIISLTAICGSFFLLVIGLIKVFKDMSDYPSIIAGILTLVILFIILILFQRVKKRSLLDSIFFKDKLTYQKILEDFSRRANSVLDIKMLLNLLVSTVFDAAKVNCVGIMLFEEQSKKYTIRVKQCDTNINIDNLSIDEDNVLIRWMQDHGFPLWKEEMRIDPQYYKLKNDSEIFFNKSNVSLLAPIIHKETLTGLLIIGEKNSGELYNDDDIRFLTTISNLTATAIANSLAYKEVERRLSEQTLLFVLSKTFGRTLKLETVMDSVLKILIYFLNLDYCAVIKFTDGKVKTAFFSSGFTPGVKNAIEQFGAMISGKPECMKRDESVIILDVEEVFARRDDLSEVERETLLSSIFAVLEQDDKPLGLMVMSNWIGSGTKEQRLDILRTILAIITQGLMMHQTFSDLASMKSYNENIIESINTMGDMLIVFGFDGRIRRVNKATCDRLGYSQSELIEKDIGIILQKKDIVLSALRKRHSIQNYETTLLTHHRESVFVLFSSSIMEDSSGQTEEIVGMARDISDIKETEEKYRTLFEEVKDVVFICDLDGKFLDINPAGVDLFEYSSEDEILQIDVKKDLFSDASEYEKFREKLIGDSSITNYELSLKNRKGKEVNVIVTASVIHDVAGSIVAYRGIMKDITEQRALHHQLIQAQKMESIGTLAGGVAHDFNNIMTAILGYSSIMKMNMKDDHPFFNYLNTIESSANRAAQLTNQLLAFARAGKHNVKALNINTITKETVNLLKETFDRSIEIESILEDELPAIEGDANQIQQIIMNLCVNARDAMPDGGKLTVRTDTATITNEYAEVHLGSREGDYVRLTVSDTGIGIDESIIGRIFDPFFTTKGPGEGTGLGLSVVYGVVKNHEGYIDARSKPGEGTTFEIFFPVVKAGRIEEEEVHIEPPAGKNELILIIDDEETVRKLAKELLEKYGYQTLLASDGEEGVDLFKNSRDEVKLVIIDMIMPKLSGLETFQTLKEIDPAVKVLLSTGYDHSERVQEILDSGVSGFIKKPYNITDLLLQVREVIDG